MQKITGLIGRDDLVMQVVKEIKKGKHIVLTGPVEFSNDNPWVERQLKQLG